MAIGRVEGGQNNLGFDFLIQFYEGHLLVEARHNRCNNRILLNLLSFIPSNMLRKEKLVNEAKVVISNVRLFLLLLYY